MIINDNLGINDNKSNNNPLKIKDNKVISKVNNDSSNVNNNNKINDDDDDDNNNNNNNNNNKDMHGTFATQFPRFLVAFVPFGTFAMM